jgi:hypothetical protein
MKSRHGATQLVYAAGRNDQSPPSSSGRVKRGGLPKPPTLVVFEGTDPGQVETLRLHYPRNSEIVQRHSTETRSTFYQRVAETLVSNASPLSLPCTQLTLAVPASGVGPGADCTRLCLTALAVGIEKIRFLVPTSSANSVIKAVFGQVEQLLRYSELTEGPAPDCQVTFVPTEPKPNLRRASPQNLQTSRVSQLGD